MNLDELLKRREILEKVQAKARKMLEDAPEGSLRIFLVNGREVCYLRKNKSDRHGRYIPARDRSLAKALALKGYAEKVVRKSEEEIRIIDRYIAHLRKGSTDELYSKMSKLRKMQVPPLLLTDDEVAAMWAAQEFEQSNYMPEHKVFSTKRGEMVRSKSEVMLADMFYEMGIPYRYEPVIRRPGGVMFSPDFALWDKKRRREIYHEHFGMIDDPVYRRERFLHKIDEYRKIGIYFGNNLMATFEGDGAVFNMKEIRKMFAETFL